MSALGRIELALDLMRRAHAGDPEGAHLRADELLVEAVRELGAETSYPESEIESLIAAYERVPKWYA